LQGLDRHQRVIYIGTFSKVLFPALRLGYLVVPPKLVEPFLAMRRFTDTHLPVLEQMALADFITEGHFVRHIRRMRTIYAARRDTLMAAIKSELGGWLEVPPPEAGMHLTGWLPPGIDDILVARQAAGQGIDVVPVSNLSINPLPRGGLVLSYAATNEADIKTGVRKLGQVLQSLPGDEAKIENQRSKILGDNEAS
jgi:GntR family transcriptional regulator/MocR family aminotransferase